MDLEQNLGPNLVKTYHGRGVWEIFWRTIDSTEKKFSKLKLMKSFLQIDYVKESLSRLIILWTKNGMLSKFEYKALLLILHFKRWEKYF